MTTIDHIAQVLTNLEAAELKNTRLRDANAELRAALDEVTLCPTCDGTGIMELDCDACLNERPHSKCEYPRLACAHCEGTGRLWNDSEKAKALFPGINPSPDPAESTTGHESAGNGGAS